jgi:hypothetical protein
MPGFDYSNPENDEKEVITELLNWIRKRYGYMTTWGNPTEN